MSLASRYIQAIDWTLANNFFHVKLLVAMILGPAMLAVGALLILGVPDLIIRITGVSLIVIGTIIPIFRISNAIKIQAQNSKRSEKKHG
ncbi:MAG: hypothetical protein ABW048_13760 [Sphingobium sp.]